VFRGKPSWTGREAAGAVLTVAALLLATGLWVPAAGARLVLDEHTEASATIRALATHWRAADHAALADQIAADGARIAIGPDPDRENLYSPSQSFYFFKNLFQAFETEEFVVETSQASGDDQAHALVRWVHRRSGTDRLEESRLVISLIRGPDGWAVTEIRTLR
jgi:hypothetical protein